MRRFRVQEGFLEPSALAVFWEKTETSEVAPVASLSGCLPQTKSPFPATWGCHQLWSNPAFESSDLGNSSGNKR